MIIRAATVRCLTCNAPCPPGLAAKFAKDMQEKAVPLKSMSEGEAIATGTIMMIVVEHHLMVCKHHGEKDCACHPDSLITEGEYYNGKHAH